MLKGGMAELLVSRLELNYLQQKLTHDSSQVSEGAGTT
jgi:hypothetical protein